VCPHCQAALPAASDEAASAITEEGPEETQAIARFRNAAEAGFFLDELTRRLQISAEIAPRENFDAIHASWSTDFVLHVPRESALAAAQCLQELVEQSAEGKEEDAAAPTARAMPLPLSRVMLPLSILIAVGALSFWLFEQFDRPGGAFAGGGRRSAAPLPRLMQEMRGSPGPWVQPIPGTPGTRRVTFDRGTRTIIWEEDRDGDGKYETRRSEAWGD
jgi:hypothetical protein